VTSTQTSTNAPEVIDDLRAKASLARQTRRAHVRVVCNLLIMRRGLLARKQARSGAEAQAGARRALRSRAQEIEAASGRGSVLT
jgi:hypothetical protein